MYHIGVVGCGKIAQVRHIPEYASHLDAKLWAFYDLNQSRAETLAKKYGAKAYASVEELLNDPQIDAVSVCVANHAHAQITIAALKAGKHVLCEKPMAVTLQECEEMVHTAKETGKFLMIGHNQRLARAHVLAKKLLTRGEIGNILTVRSTFGHGGPETWSIDPGSDVWFFDKKQSAMGAMADLGIHKTDLIQYLCGTTWCVYAFDQWLVKGVSDPRIVNEASIVKTVAKAGEVRDVEGDEVHKIMCICDPKESVRLEEDLKIAFQFAQLIVPYRSVYQRHVKSATSGR